MIKILNKKINTGITLIALVITIVVLIILAAVAINLSLGNNGIFNRAKTAKEQYSNATEYEETEVSKITNQIDSYVGGNRDDKTITMTEEQLRTLIQEEIKKNQHIYPKGTKITLDSGNFSTTKTTTAPGDGWITLRGYIHNTNTKGFYLKVGELEQAFCLSEDYTLAASLPCKKGDTILYQLTDWTTTKFAYLYFIPMETNEE